MKWLLKKIIGTKNERDLKKIRPLVERIKQMEVEYQSLSDDELKAKPAEFRERLAKGETVDDLMCEAYAVVKNACRRLCGTSSNVCGHELAWEMVPFDVQLIGGIVLHEGKIAEMKTGEGKTLAATLALYLNALTGKGAHLVTVNDYLATRDAEWMGAIYKFLGLSVGVVVHGMSDGERKKAYGSDITYGTNNEFGFDYLRDNMKFDMADYAQREFNYAIVDEVDSILIDESRTPLIISGPVEKSENKVFTDVKPLAIKLKSAQGKVIHSILNDLQKRLDTGEVDEKTIEMLVQIKRGDPKNTVFLDILAQNQHLKKQLDRMESMLSSQKLLPELDQDLYCTIDEHSNAVELTEKGIKLLGGGGQGFCAP